MRILHITASLKIGGAEKVARDIGMGAVGAGHEVHYLVFGSETGDYEKELESAGAVIIRVPSPSRGYGKYVRTLRDLIRDNRYAAVHAHTMFSIGWAMLAAAQCGVPVRVAHAHSALDDGRGLVKNVYERAMRGLILRFATHLVACGDAAGIRLYGKKAYEERGIRILNGIDVNAFAFRQDAREKTRRSAGLENAYVIGHVGHLAAVKNQAFLIRLMQGILKRKPEARLLLLGEGEDRAALEKLIRDMRLAEHVVMTGNVRNVADYLCAMDVFAFPSIYEGMPLSIVEVQANGLPCILSTGVPCDVHLTDLIKTLPLDEPEKWIDAICAAERRDTARYAEEIRKKGFDTDNVMRRFLRIYEGQDGFDQNTLSN